MRTRRVIWPLLTLLALAAPGCLYPEYQFDLEETADAGDDLADGQSDVHADTVADQLAEPDAAEADAPDVGDVADAGDADAADARDADAADADDAHDGDADADADASVEAEAGDADAEADADASEEGSTDAPADAPPDAPVEAAIDAADETPPDAPADAPPASTCPGGASVDGFACVAMPASSLWRGPYAFYFAPGGTDTTTQPCPTGFSVLFDGAGKLLSPYPAASCPQCSCGPLGGTCSKPTVDLFGDDACGAASACGSASATDAGPCSAADVTCAEARSVRVGTSSWSGGTCAASPSPVVPVLAPAFNEMVRACAPTVAPARGECAANEVCAPVNDSPTFGATLCILASGTQSCPAGWTKPHANLVNEVIGDTRGCTACSCTPPSSGAVSCGGAAADLYESSECSGVASLSPTAATCAAIGPTAGPLAVDVRAGSPSGTCAATGGKPTGSVLPNFPDTVCCK